LVQESKRGTEDSKFDKPDYWAARLGDDNISLKEVRTIVVLRFRVLPSLRCLRCLVPCQVEKLRVVVTSAGGKTWLKTFDEKKGMSEFTKVSFLASPFLPCRSLNRRVPRMQAFVRDSSKPGVEPAVRYQPSGPPERARFVISSLNLLLAPHLQPWVLEYLRIVKGFVNSEDGLKLVTSEPEVTFVVRCFKSLRPDAHGSLGCCAADPTNRVLAGAAARCHSRERLHHSQRTPLLLLTRKPAVRYLSQLRPGASVLCR
jgi:hypothetical protein